MKNQLESTTDKTARVVNNHPWKRYFARSLDMTVVVTAVIMTTTFLSIYKPNYVDPSFLEGFLSDAFLGVLACLCWLPLEALFLSRFATTPAKWFFGIKITDTTGNNLSYKMAFKRSLLVSIIGEALGVSIINFIGHVYGYLILKDTGTTPWDKAANSVVTVKKWSKSKTVFITGLTVLILALPIFFVNKLFA